MSKSSTAEQREVIANVIRANMPGKAKLAADLDFDARLTVTKNADGSVTARHSDDVETTFLQIIGRKTLTVSVKSTAIGSSGGGMRPG